jgi:carbamoyltransferase
MRILGITDGQTSGAAIIEDGRIICAINEERIVRIKLARGFPWKSIAEVMTLSGTKPQDIEGVAVGQYNMELREEVTGWPGWFEARAGDGDLHSKFFNVASKFGKIANTVPGLKSAYYALRTPAYTGRRKRIEEILKQDFGVHAPVEFVNHHYAHATSAYYTSNFDEALVVTMDGGGDGHCSHVYSVKDGVFEHLDATDSYNSIGNFYAYVTAICGYKAKRHEGKITGLAARGKPVYKEMFDKMISWKEDQLVNHSKLLFQSAMDKIKSNLPSDWTKEDLACSIQLVAEQAAKDLVSYWVKKTGHKNVALAGGLFANVRINEEVHVLPGVESTFVHPGMTDEGLAVSAGLAMQGRLDRERGKKYEPWELKNVYFGNSYSDAEIAKAVEKAGLSAVHHPGDVESEIGEKLSQGKVVARFNGGMEYGPRALGNRTIMYQPGDPSVNDWLNELLKRTEFMPFAPSSLASETNELYQDTAGALDTARFMTITFHCTPWMVERCSGVVHVDNTARPQIVREQDNPSYHKIITEYHKRTGVPVIINTSFNIHEEPIVRSPDDAVRAFLDSALDYLAIGEFMIEGPVGSMETRAKWEGKSKWGRATHAPTSR